MLVLAQKEPILKAIINICIKIHQNVVFFQQDRVKFNQMVFSDNGRNFSGTAKAL